MHVSTVLPRSLTCCNSLKVVATPGRLYIVGRKPLTDSSIDGSGERADASYRILEFDRTLQAPGSLSEIVFEHDRSYSQQEAEHLLRDLVTPWLGAGSAGAATTGGGSSQTTSSGQGLSAVAAAAIPALSLSSSLYGDSSASSSWASGAVLVFDAVALVGAITFTRGYYLVLITKGQKVGTVGDHAVWVPKATEFLPIAVEAAAGKASAASAAGSAVLGAFGGKLSEALQPRLASLGTLGLTLAGSDAAAIAESRYQSLFLSIDLTREFMYSDSYDLTRPLQQQVLCTVDGSAASTRSEQQEHARGPVEMFTWNSYLRSELLHPDTGPCISTLTGTRISSWWTTPIIHGYFRQVTIRALGAPVLVTLIARRSRHFAGTRYLKRGADPLGHVANEVETEQIVEDCSGGRTGIQGTGTGTTFSSFVHMRGSIPCYWTQTTSVAVPKPPIVLQPRDPLHGPARHHFSDLFARYGGTVMCLNLVKKKEKGTPREKLLGREYARLVCALNRELPPVVEVSRPGQGLLNAMSALQHAGVSDIADRQDKETMPLRLQYLHLDYNGIVKSSQHNVLAILRDAGRWALSTTGCFASAMLPAAVEERRYRARTVKVALEVVPRSVGPAGVHDLDLVVVDPDAAASLSKREQTRLTVDTVTESLPVPGPAVTVLPASTGSSSNLLSSLSKQRKGGAPGTPSLSFMSSASGTQGGTSRLPQQAASEAAGVAAAGDTMQPYLPSLSAIGSFPAVMFLDGVSSSEGVDLMNTFVRTEIHKSADKRTGLEYLHSKMHDQSSITGISDSAEAAPSFSGVRFTPCHVRSEASTNRTAPLAVPKHHAHARGAVSKQAAPSHSHSKHSVVDWDSEPADGPRASVLGAVLSQLAGEGGTGHASKGHDERSSSRQNGAGPLDHAVSPVSALTSASSQHDDEEQGEDPAAQGGGGRLAPQDDPASHAEDGQQLPTPVLLQQDENSRALDVAAVAIAAALDADDDDDREADRRARWPKQVADAATSSMQMAPESLTLEHLRAVSSAPQSVLDARTPTPVAQSTGSASTPTAPASGGTKGVTASSLFGRLGFGAKAAAGSSSSFGSPGAAPAVTPVTLSLDSSTYSAYDGSSKGGSLQPEGPSLFGTMYVELVKGYGTSMNVKPSAGEGGVTSSGDKDEDSISTSANVLDPDPFPEDESPGSSTAGVTPIGALPGVSSALSGPGSLLGLDMGGGSRTLVVTSSSSGGVVGGGVVQSRDDKSAALQEAVGQALHVRNQEEAARAASEARHTFSCTSDQDAIFEEGGKGGNKNRAGLAQRMREYASISGQGEYTYIDLVPAAAEGTAAAAAATQPLPAPVPKLQRGVLRTNCVDCLDRTNVAQLTVGLYALGVQLASLGLDAGDAQPDASSPFVRALMDMYTEHGDAIARQYGGSEANKKVTATAHADGIAHQEATGAERGSGRAQGREKVDSEKASAGSGWSIFGGSSLSTSGGKEAVAAAQAQLTSHVGRLKLASSGPGEILTSLQRYYSNSFTDSIKQAAINLLLGVYQPRLHGPNGQMTGKGLVPGVHLWEMESDWCLHSSSSLSATALVPASTLRAPMAGDWWSAPLARYAQVGYPRLAEVQALHPPTALASKTPQVASFLSSFDDDASLAPVGGQLTMAARIPTPTAQDAGMLSPWKSQSGEDKGVEGAVAAAVSAASNANAPKPPTGRPPRSGVNTSSGGQPGTPIIAAGGSSGKGNKRSNSIDSTASSGGTPPAKSGTPRSAGGTPTRSRLADDRFGLSLFADVLNPSQLAERASQKAAAAIARLEDRLEAVADNAADVAKAGARSVVGHAWQAVAQASGAVHRATSSVTRQGISAASQVVDAVDAVSEGVQDAMSTAASVLLPPFAAIQQLEEEEIARLRAAAPETGPGIEESKPVLENELGEDDGDGSLASQLNLAPSLLSPLQPSARVRKGHPSLASAPSTGFGAEKQPGDATSSQSSLAPDYRHFERDGWFGQHATVQLSESDMKLYESYCALAGVVAGGSGGAALGTKMPSQAAPKVHVLTERTEIERFRRVLSVGQPALLAALPVSGTPSVSKSASPPGAAPQAPAVVPIDPVENVAPPADVWQWSDHGVITKGPFSGMPHDRPAGPVLRSLVSRGEVDRATSYRDEVTQGSGTNLRKWVHAPAVLVLHHSGPKAW